MGVQNNHKLIPSSVGPYCPLLREQEVFFNVVSSTLSFLSGNKLYFNPDNKDVLLVNKKLGLEIEI